MRRRKAAAATNIAPERLERLVGGLRRLQNPLLRAYRSSDVALLSEPFGAVPSKARAAPAPAARRAVSEMLGRPAPQALVSALAPFGERALQRAVNGGVRIAIVPAGRRFTEFSPCVSSLVPDIDGWPAPPAGLFVLEERLLLLRSKALRMTAAHEFGHALDAVLAKKRRSYHSFEDEAVRHRFATATGFVNAYAASGLDEYFAECLRAYVEVNDDRSSWLPLTRLDLLTRDEPMFSLVDDLFARGMRG
ncbi:MAG: hypothetical protein ACR2KS_12025 [Candidatus Eremiobacter antarcticus]|nr:hypothetical protein [Candidatus Eremiobacteraeota bacterium]MBC5809093.1 hypothetical protein [Candidatus Eremiobacteraeota bacterium]